MRPRLVIGNKNYSSWSLRAWLLLSEAGIEFDEVRLAMDTPAFDEIRRYNPAARVPVLLLDEFAIWDTLAIAETAAERWPECKLWPEDANARARARSLAAEMHSGFMTLRDSMPMNCRAMGRKVPLPRALTSDIDRIFDIWAGCQAEFSSGEGWLFGHFTVTDAMFAPVVLRFRTYGINLPESASRYPERLLQSHALQRWIDAACAETEVIDHEEVGL